jgi:YD repeat-containing protein
MTFFLQSAVSKDALGRRSSMTRNGGTSVTSTFDTTTGRLSQLSTPTGNLSYGYELDGSKSKVETLNGKTEYQYDNQGRVTGVGTWQPGNAWNPSPQFNPYASYIYDAAGQLITITRVNNITTNYSYVGSAKTKTKGYLFVKNRYELERDFTHMSESLHKAVAQMRESSTDQKTLDDERAGRSRRR